MSSDELFEAGRKGDIVGVRQAVTDGVDVTKVIDKRRKDFTPLHYACQYVCLLNIMSTIHNRPAHNYCVMIVEVISANHVGMYFYYLRKTNFKVHERSNQ